MGVVGVIGNDVVERGDADDVMFVFRITNGDVVNDGVFNVVGACFRDTTVNGTNHVATKDKRPR